MGSNHSRASSDESEALHQKNLKKKRQVNGDSSRVLVPPAFGIEGTFENERTTPSYMEHLRVLDPSYRILNDNYKSGVRISADTSYGYTRATMELSPFNRDNKAPFIGRITGHLHGWEDTLFKTGTTGVPFSVTQLISINDGLHLYGNIDANGSGWASGVIDATIKERKTDGQVYYRNDPYDPDEDISEKKLHVKLASWFPYELRASGSTLSPTIPHVYGVAGVNFLGATAVIETKISTDTLEMESSSFFTMNLSDNDKTPFKLSLERSETGSSAVCLSQIFTFDRWQFNPLENRAPKIRNVAAWAVRLEQPSGTGVDSEKTSPKMTVGGGWQINRNIAIKAKIDTDSRISTALLLKQWQHPRLTVSLLHEYHVKEQRSHFLGVSIDLEALSSRRGASSDVLGVDYYASDAPPPLAHTSVPATKTILSPSHEED